jgi:TrmH family RNA methyltransferase
MISKAKLKYIKSLQVKKYRNEEQRFLVEGAKSIKEILQSDYEVELIAGVSDFLASLSPLPEAELIACSENELSSLGSFQTNEAAIAVAKMKPNKAPILNEDAFVLVLDDIRDPGNLGTIIRTADWYGIKNIIASENTTDLYNPKVITASMGSFTRISVYYCNLAPFIVTSNRMAYGAFLDGADVHQLKPTRGAMLVMGNESKGISAAVEAVVNQRLTIPRYGKAESLNVGIATAILLDNFVRLQK